jgi:hypothetical protein
MKSYGGLDLTKNLPNVDLFPVLWADEGADLDEENEEKFKDMIVKPSMIVNGLAIGLGMVVGALMFIFGIFILVRSAKNNNQQQHYQSNIQPINLQSSYKE